MGTSALRNHQLMLLEMLHVIDSICEKHNIQYMLFAGTALGAVRHQGFIPWDDDLDIVMLRPEYERFLKIAPGELDSEKYYLQREFSDHWPMFFSKLRKNGTACMEKFHPKDRKMHQGIYIDIFPCDNLQDRFFAQKMQFLASKVVIAKSLNRRGYSTDCVQKKFFIAICHMLPLKPTIRLVQNKKMSCSNLVHTFLGASSRFEKATFPREWFTELERVRFEDGLFPVSRHYDALLKKLYGDYLILPSEKERECKVHTFLVDLNHSYEEFVDWQMEQTIEIYSRSIR